MFYLLILTLGCSVTIVFKVSKVTVVLDHRSESITKFLNLFLKLVRQSPIFEEKLVRAGAKTNILGTKEARKYVSRGLGRLRSEGWLSESDFHYYEEQLRKT